MMVARRSIDAKFGYKQNVIDLMQRWLREIAPWPRYWPLLAGEKLEVRIDQQLRDMKSNRSLVRSFFDTPTVT